MAKMNRRIRVELDVNENCSVYNDKLIAVIVKVIYYVF